MDVILDTNIFRSDIALASKDIDVLLDYLARTDSSVILPQIILDEAVNQFRKNLTDRLADLKKSSQKFNRALVPFTPGIETPDINIDEQVDGYTNYIKDRLRILDIDIIPYNNDFLPEISQRAIERRKPCGQDGQGFRDALIWLTIKEYTKSCHENQVTFISQNTKDFAGNDDGLHDSLLSECKEERIMVNYFTSLKEFIVNHSTTIAQYDLIWVEHNVDLVSVAEELSGQIEWSDSDIVTAFERDNGVESSGRFKVISAHPNNPEDLYIYEMSDGSLVLSFALPVEVEIEIDYFVPADILGHPGYDVNTYKGIIDIHAYLSATLNANQDIEWEVSEWDFYCNWENYF